MKTVLIVEDEKMIRQGIRAMIQRSGVPVEVIMECGNGEMALDILRSQKVDVMFTDIRMPKMTGVELVQRIQELDEKPLVVAVSGYADFSYAVEMLRMGPYPPPLKRRILSSQGHLSNGACAGILPWLLQSGVRRFMLAHLSRENNSPQLAEAASVAALTRPGMCGRWTTCWKPRR